MTKKLAALALALALPALASAGDINPGALQLSGKTSFGYGSQTYKTDLGETDVSTLGGSLSAMYYVSKFLAFGLATEYENTTEDDGTGEQTSSLFLFGPKAGIDYQLMNHLSVFADGTVGMAQIEALDEKATGVGLEIAAGFKLFLNSNVSLDLMGNFRTVRVGDHPTLGKITDTGFGAMIGFSLYLTNNPANASGYQPPPAPAPYPYR